MLNVFKHKHVEHNKWYTVFVVHEAKWKEWVNLVMCIVLSNLISFLWSLTDNIIYLNCIYNLFVPDKKRPCRYL